ncbi:MAG: HAD family phosphatase [Rhizobiales bacterium]|nr:HAD family phosphatase [Hyphomicrobiales bacterium]MBO6699199.1 HAD family phosphatase [Hyphomicrobiales bacterium]MBO6736737.1 HAD family phosphatase [Hyphomicrobiales bacterium]MBO6912189.1 HAD family phosphatase [Hyphomicrobiales bacterium]MBO6956684.1 HAD family phosphatase [Hyphomicrobiales bacterium]
MAEPQIDAVVFDIGNVLLDWDARRVYRPLGMSDDEIAAFFERVDFDAWNLEQDRGRPFAEGVEALAKQFPDDRALIERYHTHWIDSISGPINGSVGILQRLVDENVPVHAITNFSAEKFSGERERFAFLNQFGVTVVSGEERIIKPDPAIYHLLLERAGLPADRTVFIDDSPKNVEGARAVGMHAILFTTPSDLREALRGFALPGGVTV